MASQKIKKTYTCGICNNEPTQISHHKSHLKTEKHKDKKQIYELTLLKLTEHELMQRYKTTDVPAILTGLETILYQQPADVVQSGGGCVGENVSESEDNHSNLKKMKCDGFNEETTNYTQEQLAKMEHSFSISSKEALKSLIHEIHNYLRNNGVGYGMNALKVFNIFFGLKKLEEKGYHEMVGLPPDCAFSVLLEMANNGDDELLLERVDRRVLEVLSQSPTLRHILFYEIPIKNIRANVISRLIKYIEDITVIEKTCNVQLSGKIYEYFIGRDESAISELGAYFTDRHIVEYIYGKLNPQVNPDGSIGTMIDMFGGSGGFTTGYINYLKENNQEGTIDWRTELRKVYHYDMNDDVIKSAALEFICLTGVIPDMDTNMGYRNSFAYEFDVSGIARGTKQYYKYVVTNPPYGGDSNKKSEASIKRDKIIAYIKNQLPTITDTGLRLQRQTQLERLKIEETNEKKEQDKTKVSLDTCSSRINAFARKHKLKGTDKEACSLILMMDVLEEGGTSIGVLKEGVFFNKSYKELRRCLITNYNVREVISVPQDQFENTSTKTSIVIFDNTPQKTTQVIFRDLIVDRYEEDRFEDINGTVVLVENKGDIRGIRDVVVSTARVGDILDNAIVSLNGKDYNNVEVEVREGYKLVKLGDISEFMKKSKRPASFGNEEGQYNFYTSSDKVQRCDVADYREECLIIGTGGVANIKLDNMFSCSADNIVMKTPHNKYIYYLLKANISILENKFSGSTIKHISKDSVMNLNIPIPTDPAKTQYWVDYITEPYNAIIEKKEEISQLEECVQESIKQIMEHSECEEVELGSICEIKTGNVLTKDKATPGCYNVYGGGMSSYTHNTFNTSGFSIIVSRVGNNNVKLVQENCYITDNAFSINVNETSYHKYVGYYLILNETDVLTCGNGSAQKVISKKRLSTIKIKIPKDKTAISDMDPTFERITELHTELKQAEDLYKIRLAELMVEALPL